MWQIFIRTSWRSHKHCKCSFSLTSGPRYVGNVRSCLLLVVRHDRFNLLSVASIKHSVDIMLKYIESDSTLSDMQLNKENLIIYSIDRQRVKCGKYSFAHHGGPISIANVRSRLLAVPEMWRMFVLAYY